MYRCADDWRMRKRGCAVMTTSSWLAASMEMANDYSILALYLIGDSTKFLEVNDNKQ